MPAIAVKAKVRALEASFDVRAPPSTTVAPSVVFGSSVAVFGSSVAVAALNAKASATAALLTAARGF